MAAKKDALEVVNQDTGEVTYSQPVQLGMLGGDSATKLVQSATAMADVLARIVKDRQLTARISGRDYVRCEGWTTLAALGGVLPREVACKRDPETGAYVAIVELVRMDNGNVLTRASAECGAEDDRPWNRRPAYARRSMAITRATGKACRIAFSWIMSLAGYSATPAEEMPDEADAAPRPDAKPEVVSTPRRAPQQTTTPRHSGGPTDKQLKRLFAIAKDNGITHPMIKEHLTALGVASSHDLTREQYDAVCEWLESADSKEPDSELDSMPF